MLSSTPVALSLTIRSEFKSNTDFGEHISIMGGIVCGAQLIPPLLSIIPTELALSRNFDKEGIKK